ncbi:hypothetical protein K8R78_06285 [bacterium]|nr:hypothetical protein [bacterium]
MKATVIVLSLFVSMSFGFSLLPWEAGQWASYDSGDEVGEMLFSLVETADAPDWLWIQVELTILDLGPMVVQLAFDEVGVEAVFSQLEGYLNDPEGLGEEFSDFALLLEQYASFCPEIRLGMADPMSSDEQMFVLSIDGTMLFEFAGMTDLFQEEIDDIEELIYIVEDGVGITATAGDFLCRRITSERTTALYSEAVPIFGLVSTAIEGTELEDSYSGRLMDYGLSGAEDALAEYGPPVDFMDYLSGAVPEMFIYTPEDRLDNKRQ